MQVTENDYWLLIWKLENKISTILSSVGIIFQLQWYRILHCKLFSINVKHKDFLLKLFTNTIINTNSKSPELIQDTGDHLNVSCQFRSKLLPVQWVVIKPMRRVPQTAQVSAVTIVIKWVSSHHPSRHFHQLVVNYRCLSPSLPPTWQNWHISAKKGYFWPPIQFNRMSVRCEGMYALISWNCWKPEYLSLKVI